ncbi:hypothetical protein AAFF_G00284950 [Aldrovandia affinis]|uniref:Uncharacterized protein n=1 Tax=Aldrovandia affinis TaxID=143900 RepID=A0AAD7X208_9TELE|nr:hypothetical protein AAFF_G00284950 [Aldrovandia affinis]
MGVTNLRETTRQPDDKLIKMTDVPAANPVMSVYCAFGTVPIVLTGDWNGFASHVAKCWRFRAIASKTLPDLGAQTAVPGKRRQSGLAWAVLERQGICVAEELGELASWLSWTCPQPQEPPVIDRWTPKRRRRCHGSSWAKAFFHLRPPQVSRTFSSQIA